jgi:hypothetical protein
MSDSKKVYINVSDIETSDMETGTMSDSTIECPHLNVEEETKYRICEGCYEKYKQRTKWKKEQIYQGKIKEFKRVIQRLKEKEKIRKRNKRTKETIHLSKKDDREI